MKSHADLMAEPTNPHDGIRGRGPGEVALSLGYEFNVRLSGPAVNELPVVLLRRAAQHWREILNWPR
jgi:hypothetical protein